MGSAPKNATCSAYRPGQICANGFPTNAACIGAVCWQCKRPTTQTPMCLRDEVPAHLVNEAGLPILAEARRLERPHG